MVYFLDEIIGREKLAKKMKILTTISNIFGTGLICTAVTTGSLSIPVFSSVLGLPVVVALSGKTILLPLVNSVS